MSRVLLRSSAALLLVAAAGLIGWRVLTPAEVLSPAVTPYPMSSVSTAQVTGRTNMAPLIVDERIRVYAGQRQVRADGPVDAKTVNTARWSLRRWPATVSGVVAAGTTVVSRWSDGQLVAIDARSGHELWRVTTTSGSAPAFDGHRTGASTVWAPVGLHVAAGSVLVVEGQRLSAYEVESGALLWTVTLPAGCGDGFTTLGGQYFCATGGFDAVTGVALPAYGEGPYVPLTCGVALSACQGMRDRSGQGYLTTGVMPRRAASLSRSDISVIDGAFVPLPPDVQVLGVSQGRLVVLTADRHLQILRSGDVVADFPLAVGSERLDWKPGLWQVTDDWVAVERLTGDGPADPEAPEHYFTVDTVVIAAL